MPRRQKPPQPPPSRRTLGAQVCRWIEAYCVIPDGPLIGQPFVIPAFWRRIIYEWYELVPDGAGGWRRRYSQGLVGIAKKNIKTSIGACLALWELAGSEDPAALVLTAAASEEQSANLLYGSAKLIADKSPLLKDALVAYHGEIQVPSQPRARMRNLTSRASTNDGANARAVFCDELHEWRGESGRRLFTVLEGALTSRPDATLLAITTAGVIEESVCYEKYEYGKKVAAGKAEDPRFYFRWFEAPEHCDHRDPRNWIIPNPLLDVTVHRSVLEDRVIRISEADFRRYHLNQWVAGDEIWIAAEAWDACKADDELDRDLPLHVGIDVGIRHDSSAVACAQLQPSGRTVVRVRIWINPYERSNPLHATWSLNIVEVEDYLRELRREFTVAAVMIDEELMAGPEYCYDPAYFERSAQLLAAGEEDSDEALAMVEFPQTDSRMVPASQCLYDLVVEGKIAHDGDPALRLQVLSAIADQRPRGAWRLSKPKGSLRRIDATIAMAIAVHRAQAAPPLDEGSVYDERGIITI